MTKFQALTRRISNRFPLGVFLLLLAVDAFSQEAPVYRRFIEAEQMTLEGSGYRVVPNKGSSGDSVVEASFATPDKLAAGGRLVKSLDRPLPSGRYVLWTQIQIPEGGRTNGEPVSMEINLGGSKQVIRFKDRKKSGAASAVVSATGTFHSVSLAVRSLEPRILLDRIYLSNRPGDVRPNSILKTDEIDMDLIQREMTGKDGEKFQGYPRGADSRVPAPPNWLSNGSFEVGKGNDQWSTLYQQSYAIPSESWDSTQACDGKRSLGVTLYPSGRRWQEDDPSLPTQFMMIHRVLKLQPNKTYFFRGMFRSDAPVALSLSARTAYDATVGVGLANAQIGANWQPAEMEVKTTDDPRGCYLQISATSPGRARLWMDAFTLSEKKLDAFVPSAPVEIGLHWTAPGKIFYSDEPAEMTLLAQNYASGAPAKLSVRYRIIDYFDQLVAEENIPDWNLDSTANQSKGLRLNKGKNGSFRLLIDGRAQTPGGKFDLPLQEYAFSILPRPPAAMKHTFGSYITLAPEPIEIMSRAGIRRTVTLSCSNELLQDWSRIEIEPGKFNWADQRVAHARKHDVIIIGNIDIGQDAGAIPVWARNPKDGSDVLKASGSRMTAPVSFSKKAWSNFVEKMVSHYKDTIRDWIIVDEPYHYQTTGEYTELMKATYAAAKRANPNCRIIAHGGFGEPWLTAVEKAGGISFFDGISDYARNRKQGEWLKSFSRKHGKFLLNVEYLWQTSRYETMETPDFLQERTTPWYQEVTEQVTGAITAMCWSGSEGFNLYDARYPGGDFTQFDKYKCSFEYDGSLKPTGVAYAIMAGLLDGFHGVDEPSLNPRLETFLLEDESRFAIAFRTRNREVAETKLSLPKEVKAYDFMGNPIPLGPDPFLVPNYAFDYILGPKSLLDKTRAALSAAVLSDAVQVKTQVAIDPRSGQHVLKITVANRRPDRSLKGVLKLYASPRDFWDSVRNVSLKPSESVELTFGLNFYKGDSSPVLDADSHIELFFEGDILKQNLSGLAEGAGAYMKEADDLLAANQYAKAEVQYRNILSGLSGGNASEVQLKIARCLASQNKIDEAAAEYRKVGLIEGARPQDASAAILSLGAVLEGRQKQDEALLEYQKMASLRGASAAEVVAALMKAGAILQAQKKFDEALNEYRKVASILGVTPQDVAMAQMAAGNVFESLKECDEASAEYKKALEVKGLSPVAMATVHYEIARALRARGDPRYYEDLISEYRKAIAIKEAWPVIGACAQLYLGKFMLDLKKYDEALVEFRKVVDTPGANEIYVKDAKERIEECLKMKGEASDSKK